MRPLRSLGGAQPLMSESVRHFGFATPAKSDVVAAMSPFAAASETREIKTLAVL